jgi:hypothetical protein
MKKLLSLMAGMSTSLVISAARVAISAFVVSATAIDEERTTCAQRCGTVTISYGSGSGSYF